MKILESSQYKNIVCDPGKCLSLRIDFCLYQTCSIFQKVFKQITKSVICTLTEIGYFLKMLFIYQFANVFRWQCHCEWRIQFPLGKTDSKYNEPWTDWSFLHLWGIINNPGLLWVCYLDCYGNTPFCNRKPGKSFDL